MKNELNDGERVYCKYVFLWLISDSKKKKREVELLYNLQ